MSDTPVQGLEGTDQNIQDQVDPDSLASPFLSSIPDADRNVVEKYVKDWDKNVGSKFREIHQQYQPYKELGDPDTIKEWKRVVDLIQSDPKTAYKNLEAFLKENNLLDETPPVGPSDTPKPESKPADIQGLPPEVQKKIEDMEKLVAQLSTSFLSDKEAQKVQEQAKEFDSYLDNMEQKYGKFDRDYITFQLANAPQGTNAEKVIQDFVNQYGQKPAGPKAPPPLTATGLPGTNTDIKDMSRDDVKKLALAMLPKG